MRVIAVDWSGAKKGAKQKIWLAEVRDQELVRLERGRTRRELVDHLINEAERTSDLVVGLDFAFSFPDWFLEKHGIESARDCWDLVDRKGEDWLESCKFPFWGKPGNRKPDDVPAHYRKNEHTVQERLNVLPKSVFQIGGAGAVGTASLRGIPHLLRLTGAGFSVWPFHAPSLPLVVEIYPRLLTGPVVKADEEARSEYLAREFPNLSEQWLDQAAVTEDAFDAAVSALVMGRHADELRNLRQPDDPQLLKEGAMWWPDAAPGPDSRLQEALIYAAKLHAEQTRKGGEEIPYIGHLLGVCSLTLEAGGDEDQAIAALLHDAAEDQGGRDALEEIRARFGARVASIVEACTDTFEDPKPEWRPRKERYIGRLAGKPPDALLVACSDKLYNARSIVRDVRRSGDDVFDRFTGKKEGTLWYYRAVADAFSRSEFESWLVEELDRTVAELERLVDDDSDPD